MTRLVRQEDALGCQIACCAMILGITYAEARDIYRCSDRPPPGWAHNMLDDILVNRGIGVARKHQYSAEAGEKRNPWPVEPWADLHWCQVINEYGGHAVIMLADGTVLDPACDHPRRLFEYREVQQITAIMRPPE